MAQVLPIGLKNPYVTRYLVADYGAVGDGTTNDEAAFFAAGNYAEANPSLSHILVLESGHNFKEDGAQFWTDGVRTMIVEGTGATITTAFVYDFGSGAGFGVLGASQHAPVNTVVRGATSVTLQVSGDASKLTVGAYVCICGLRLQAGGDPPNMHWFEHVKVTSVSGTTVTFDRPLRNSYLQTWPDGGAARLLTSTSWDQYIEHRNHTIDQPLGGHSRSRDIRLRNMTLLGPHAFTPTTSNVCLWNNVTAATGNPEVDKLIDVWVVRNSTVYSLLVQSSAPSLLYLDNTDLTRDDPPTNTGSLRGNPRHTIINNGSSVIRLKTGCFYGAVKSMVLANSAVSAWEWGPGSYDLGGDANSGVAAVYSMSGGVITMPRSTRVTFPYPAWVVPGNVAFFGWGSRKYGPSFKILSLTADATNWYVTTSFAGTWPTLPSAVNAIYCHPCPKLTVTNCTGDEIVLDLNNAPAGVPAGTWSRRNYDNSHTNGIQAFPLLMGRVVDITIDVTTAFTGDASAMLVRVMDVQLLNSGGTETRYEPVINMRIAGTRIITLSGVTGGPQASETGLTLPAGAWFCGGVNAGFNAFRNVSALGGSFACTITIRTDQEATADDDPDYAELVTMAEALV